MTYDRDLIGYADTPPDPKRPGGTRLALNFVMSYEEGSEPSVQDGEDFFESGPTESPGLDPDIHGRDLAAEGMFAYGSRGGFWRLLRLFSERSLPMTVFGCALALERNPRAAAAIQAAGHDVCCHGWYWVKHYAWMKRPSAHISRVRSKACSAPWATGRWARITATGQA